jgi:hypothetical protein
VNPDNGAFSFLAARWLKRSNQSSTMKVHIKGRGMFLRRFGFTWAVLSLMSATIQACTIFVLTDTNRTLFCNNEDWSDPKTVIWFVPEGAGRHGCAYVGFTDGWPQGGVNTEGLACDWVAGYHGTLEPDPRRKVINGSSVARMLETCATVEQAIAFYENTEEKGFLSGRILVADRTGASVIMRAAEGRLQFDRMNQCRGFGAGGEVVARMLAQNSNTGLTNASAILRAARSEGQYATKYSNVFDLKTGDIFLFPLPDQKDIVTLSLNEELKKGPHYYDMPRIHEQLSRSPQPLTAKMKGH